MKTTYNPGVLFALIAGYCVLQLALMFVEMIK